MLSFITLYNPGGIGGSLCPHRTLFFIIPVMQECHLVIFYFSSRQLDFKHHEKRDWGRFDSGLQILAEYLQSRSSREVVEL
jgi:hypothetical protein